MDSLKLTIRLLWMEPHRHPEDGCGDSSLDSLKTAIVKTVYTQVSILEQLITSFVMTVSGNGSIGRGKSVLQFNLNQFVAQREEEYKDRNNKIYVYGDGTVRL